VSRLIPQQTIDTLRQYSTIAVDLYGIDCDLFIPKTEHLEMQEELDIYDEKPAGDDGLKYDYHQTTVYIDWAPNIYRLRALGIFVEDQKPILAWFDPQLIVPRKSYFRIKLEFLPKDRFATNEFEVVENVIKALHDASVVNAWLIAPRRKEKTNP